MKDAYPIISLKEHSFEMIAFEVGVGMSKKHLTNPIKQERIRCR